MSTSVVDRLRVQPVLQGLPEKYLEFIASCSESVTFNKGEFLLRNQQPAQEFFLIEYGKVVELDHIHGGAIKAIETMSAPAVVGWSWLLPPYCWHFSVKAIENTRCRVVNTQPLLEKMVVDKEFAAEIYQRFMSVVVSRLQASRLQSMDIYSNPSFGEGL